MIKKKRILTVITQWIFILHLGVLCLEMIFNHVDPLGPLVGEKVRFTLRGVISITPEVWKPMNEGLDFYSKGSAVIMLKKERAFIRFDYDTAAEVFTIENILMLATQLLSYWIWLFLSLALWQTCKEIESEQGFQWKSGGRLYIAAIVFPLATYLQQLYNAMLQNKAAHSIQMPGYIIAPHSIWEMAAMLISYDMLQMYLVSFVIFLLIRLFSQASQMKREIDLVV